MFREIKYLANQRNSWPTHPPRKGEIDMVRENMTVKKTRYLSVSMNGMEVYTEGISATGSMRYHVAAAKLRLREIRRLMPLGKWSIKIEQQWPEGSLRHYQWINVTTGKLEENVM